MRVLLITLDSVRHDYIPEWFLEQFQPLIFTNARTYYAGTIPSLTSFYTGVSPVLHGVGSHHQFYKATLKRKSLYDFCSQWRIPAAFVSNEELMSYMQCVNSAKQIEWDEIQPFLDENPTCFLGIHYFSPTHAPYDSDEVMQMITKGRASNFSHWTDLNFLELAKAAYSEAIDRTFQEISELLARNEDYRAIISADHGEAFGEESMWGHEQMYIEEVLRIPFLIVGDDSGINDEVIYPSRAFKLIMAWLSP